jgi:TolB protein
MEMRWKGRVLGYAVAAIVVLGGACRGQDVQRGQEGQGQAAPALPVEVEIVFSANVNGNWDIYRMDSDGSNMTAVTNTPAVNETWGHCSAINHKFVYVAKESGIHVIGLKDPNMAMHLLPDSEGLFSRPACSGDEAILTLVKKDGPAEDAASGILMIDAKTFKVTPLMKQAGRQRDPVWFRKAKKMLYVFVPAPPKTGTELWLVSADGSEATLLCESRYSDIQPDVSLDEKRILFASNREGTYDIWCMDSDGTDPKRLTDGEGDETEPRWSPDGKSILFLSNAAGRDRLCVMDADGANARLLTDGEFDCAGPNWHVKAPAAKRENGPQTAARE